MDWEDARMFNKGLEEIKSISNNAPTEIKKKKKERNTERTFWGEWTVE